MEQKWIVPPSISGTDPMPRIEVNNPTTVPERYAVHLSIRQPHVVKPGTGAPYVDQKVPRKGNPGSCGGTLVGGTAVLTSAHCVIEWQEIGKNATTKDPVYAKVRAYSITASPRRNGANKPYGEIAVKKSFWDSSLWPASFPFRHNRDSDYAVVRLVRAPAPVIPAAGPITAASLRDVAVPGGMIIEFAHYPFGARRDDRMYHSEGFVGDVLSGFDNVYKHAASVEPGSSGSGVFEVGVDSVVGVIHAEVEESPSFVRAPGQMKSGFPNRVLMLTPDTRADILAWTSAPL